VADERFNSNALRSTHRNELRAIIVEAFADLGIEEVVRRLDEAPIANAKVNDMHAVWSHPQLKSRNRWVDVGSPQGTLPALLPPGANSAFTPRMDAIPALGEHSESILAELGYSLGDINQLKVEGAI
jgi:itaconate CoA-transferase